MSSFNLIPVLYLQRRERRRLLKRAAFVFGVVAGCLGVALGVLHFLSAGVNERLLALQSQQAMSSAERASLTELVTQRDRLGQKLSLLQSLRSGLSSEQLVLSVEGALPSDAVWFTHWQFYRDGIVTPEQQTPRSADYFLSLDAPQSVADWQVHSRMNVRGQARDHAALSGFSRSLLELPHVYEVKLQRTSLAARRGESERLVNFDLAIVMKSDASVAPESQASSRDAS